MQVSSDFGGDVHNEATRPGGDGARRKEEGGVANSVHRDEHEPELLFRNAQPTHSVIIRCSFPSISFG